MIPSILAAEVGDALKDFLATGFGPSNRALASVMDDFIEDSENLLKGPYVSVDLPFRHAPEGGEPFPETPLGFTPYRHQRQAFERLSAGRSTIVATGTGSGKTESFLYPVLDHCRKHAGEPGVKAILVYPMNALASDQARRLAQIVHGAEALRGHVTAGMYVGESEQSPRRRMTGEHLIENRETMRTNPPDILLTNYKMLDLLLTRPGDAGLWRNNAPGSLRFLVVDELHTFDGAQGTDLACLIRRLRTRLQVRDDLVCVGTSATIGADANRESVLRYAVGVFRQAFDPDAIIGESRQGIDDFLADSVIRFHLLRQSDPNTRSSRNEYATPENYFREQHALFFGDELPFEPESEQWCVELGQRLREHATFVNFLRVLDRPGPSSMHSVMERLRRSLPTADDLAAIQLLNALCALISMARSRDEGGAIRPFLNVKLHLWVRELRRMVCSLGETGEALSSSGETESSTTQDVPRYRLRHSDDLKADEESIHLPLIQCRECHVTGWGCYKPASQRRVERDLRLFYNRFFLRDVDVHFLFPVESDEFNERPNASICGKCGSMSTADAAECPDCDSKRMIRVFKPDSVVKPKSRLSRDCPHCGGREALIIVGARASSLLSTVLSQMFASSYNDDKKAIAFSDNVQDAAHRGSFFAARTWRNGIRAAIAQTIGRHEGISLRELPDAVVRWWGDAKANPDAFDKEGFISEFIAPDRLWLRDFDVLCQDGKLPANSNLLDLVQQRLRWDTLAELTFASAVGRTLERTRVAAVWPDTEAVKAAIDSVLNRIREDFGEFELLDELAARSLVIGILRRMRDRGATESPMFESYLSSGGNPFVLRGKALQDFGTRSILPVFPGEQKMKSGVERLAGSGRKSWYQRWVEKVLSPIHPLAATRNSAEILDLILITLVHEDLVKVQSVQSNRIWMLNTDRLRVTAKAASMECKKSSRELVVAEQEAELWEDVPCLDLGADDVYAGLSQRLPGWAGRLYREARLGRIVSAEHTALVPNEKRDNLQERFAAEDRKPWEPNLLSATPTLELGVDIGDLSTVLMCSVPPATMNYVQRAGRAGRRDGNALSLTVAIGKPHDLYYYAEPMEMLGNRVEPPGIFLNAPAVLERQLTAYCFDSWVASGIDEKAVPPNIGRVLDNVEKAANSGFPFPFFEFVKAGGEEIKTGFFRTFESGQVAQGGLDKDAQQYLTSFLFGAEPQDSLRLRILKRLSEVVKDRRALGNDIDILSSQIKKLQERPADDSSENEIRELTQERAALRRVRSNLNARNTWEFLTDEGLLPNYAFPEPGVTMNSVIFKQSRAEGDGGAEIQTYEYQRPAGAALREFAPENSFYAEGRRVKVERVDTRVSPIEAWRLCPSCSYCENVETGDHHTACPRCGNTMWADVGQRKEMLRLRLVHAATRDRDSRIMDERDDREPLFYTRQLVADFDPATVAKAFATAGASQVFGFEYVPSATFREINFGRLDEAGSQTDFAGDSRARSGFKVCRSCGAIQDSDGSIRHTRNCKAQDNSDMADCLYLYREFQSEAVRMLIPIAGIFDMEQRTSSFVAALELGLRRHFSGAVDHLRVMICRFSSPDSEVDVDFLMLYDTVPGGTGYLKQSMQDPENLLRIFAGAREAIAQCECGTDPDKDGCYRCVYAYRRSYDMASTSRKAALRILDAILENSEKLKEVPGLHEVKVNPLLESELEGRFIEALKEAGTADVPVRVRQDIVREKPGFVLTVGDRTYYMEAQANIGEADGVSNKSRPDFLIRPVRDEDEFRPVAIFTDGFEYHKSRTDDDSAKRMSLMRAGFRVWSITWADLESVLGKASDSMGLPTGNAQNMRELQNKLDEQWETGALRSGFSESSLKLLIAYLQNPDPQLWHRAVFTELIGLVSQSDVNSELHRKSFAEAASNLPSELRDAFDDFPAGQAITARVRSQGYWRFVRIFLGLPLFALQEPLAPEAMIAAIHLDDAMQSDQPNYRKEWNAVLHWFNLLQFLPNCWWITTKGVESDKYAGLQPVELAGGTEEWSAAIDLASPELRELLLSLAKKDFLAPVVGFELGNDAGEVQAEAELAWESGRIAVLLPGQDAAPFERAQWRIFDAHDPKLLEALAN